MCSLCERDFTDKQSTVDNEINYEEEGRKCVRQDGFAEEIEVGSS